MSDEKKTKLSAMSLALIAIVVLVAGIGAYVIVTVLLSDAPQKRSQVATVNLVRPPPPPIKEKPPEPEPMKEIKKEVVETVVAPDNAPQSAENDPTPAGDKLGVDAEGQAGADGFGLVGKKGGRSLTAGGDGGLGKSSLFGKYGWYNQIVETEINRKVIKHLEEKGGIPGGKFQLVLRVAFDASGAVVDYRVIGSSGNHKMDDAVKQSMKGLRISEPPPEGMPLKMNVRLNYRG